METEERNAQPSPISRLPTELLTTVIKVIIHDPTYSHRGEYLPGVSIAVSQVCRFWREAAFSPACRALWAHVPLRHNADCVDAFMKRSHPLPTIVAIELGNTSTPTSFLALAQAMLHMDRIGCISFHTEYQAEMAYDPVEEDLRRRVYDILSAHPAPSLKDFIWSCLIDDGFDDLILPTSLFGGRVPESLRRVRMEGTEIPLEHTILRANLTSLDLTWCMAWRDIDGLLDSLSCMSGLQHFVLDATLLWNDGSSQSYDLRSVDLPCLRTFCIRGDATLRMSALVFAYLRIPINTRIHLSCDFGEALQADVTLLCNGLVAHYRSHEPKDGTPDTFSSVSVRVCGANTDGLVLGASVRGGTPRLSLALSGAWPPKAHRARITSVVHTILSLPAARHARRFDVAHINWFALGRVADWFPLHTYLPDLDSIHVSRSNFRGLAPLLLSPSSTEAPTAFTSLKQLHITSLTFDTKGPEAAFFFVALTRIAHYRAACGHPLKSIVFRSRWYATVFVKLLSNVLPEVDVREEKDGTMDHALETFYNEGGDRDITGIEYM
ncbi:unnamed protein product [Peniophora sp. CBMAI 1063]|nr:unnamed protein product [Peniophora sp. CBMAI 1063]